MPEALLKPMFAALLLLLGGLATDAAAEEWVLMGRHGGCVALSKMAERKPIFQGITSPDQLVARLDQRQIAYTKQETAENGVRIITLTVPSLSLAVLIAPRSLCRK